MISDAEREKARAVSFSSATYRDNQVIFPTTRPDELVFQVGDGGWVEGTTPNGDRVRIPLAEVDRFDIELSEREGDDKTHHFYWMVIAAGPRKLIYTTREPEYAYNPIPGLTRKDCADLNLGALGHLVPLACLNTPFRPIEPWRAFRTEGDAGPPKTPEQKKKEEVTNGQLAGCCVGWVGFMVLMMWWLKKRLSG